MSQPAKKAKTAASNGTAGILLTFGESMIRFAPLDESPPATATRAEPQPFLRSVGGDELNVAVALSKLGERTRWISVVPQGPMGDVVVESGTANGVTVAGPRPATGDVGTFTVLPEAKTVHYQRRNGAFALHDPATLDWPTLLGGLDGARPWLHMTGITPMVSPAARQSWDAAILAAAAGVPMSLDLNHRKQLGTLAELWAIVEPHASKFEVIILSLEQLSGLCAHLNQTGLTSRSRTTRTTRTSSGQ